MEPTNLETQCRVAKYQILKENIGVSKNCEQKIQKSWVTVPETSKETFDKKISKSWEKDGRKFSGRKI